MDVRKGVLISRTNLVESKRETALPWKGAGLITLATLLLWAGVFILNDLAKRNMVTMQAQINEAKQGRDYQKIAYVSDSEARLGSIRQIISERTDWEKIIQKIEENTLPEITYSAMDGSVVTQNNQALLSAGQGGSETLWQLELKGTSMGIDTLAKQVMAYEGTKDAQGVAFAKNVYIQKIDIKKTDTGETDNSGSIDFTIKVNLDPNIAKASSSN